MKWILILVIKDLKLSNKILEFVKIYAVFLNMAHIMEHQPYMPIF